MKKGFTLVEMMIGLMFTGMLMILLLVTLNLALNTKDSIKMIDQNEIGIVQLQHEMNFASNVSYKNKELCYNRLERNFCLSVDNNRLVKLPGYEIFLIDFESLVISLEDDLYITLDGERYVVKLIR